MAGRAFHVLRSTTRLGLAVVSAAMNRGAQPLLFTILALTAPALAAQEAGPVESIRNADWEQYKGEYAASPLCERNEITLWSCSVGKREYALCSSHVVNRTQGYMQYRASKARQIVFTYPARRLPPTGSFTYTSYGNGGASMEFATNGYRYTLLDPLRSASSIVVEAPGGKVAEIQCGGNQTLQINYTMRLMYDSGVWDR